jgi:hypothetical protein
MADGENQEAEDRIQKMEALETRLEEIVQRSELQVLKF